MSESGLGSPAAVSTPSRLSLFLDRAGLQGFPWVSAIVLYTISWGWILIVRDSYWADDWYLFPPYAQFDWSEQGFAPWLKYQVDFLDFAGVATLHVIIFLCFFLSALFLFGILGKQCLFSLSDSRFIVLLFLILPFNTARVALMVFWYTTGYFIFFAGWYFLIRSKSLSGRILATLLFFVSFQLHSLLPYYLLPLFHYFFMAKAKTLKELLRWFKSNSFIVSLPVIYWIMRANFWPERVLYHDVTAKRAIDSLSFMVLLVLVFATTFYFHASSQRRETIKKLSFSSLAILIGLLPYFLIGHYSLNPFGVFRYFLDFFGRSNWYSRHQILQPLGVAMIIVSTLGLRIFRTEKLRRRAICVVLAISSVFNFGFGFEYMSDFSKQQVIVKTLKDKKFIDAKNLFEFIDETALLNGRSRHYRERDWKGLIWLAYGEAEMKKAITSTECTEHKDARLVLIQGPETHWQALKNWVRDRDMGFKVTVDDTPGACKPEMVTPERVSGAIPILFYFTGAKN